MSLNSHESGQRPNRRAGLSRPTIIIFFILGVLCLSTFSPADQSPDRVELKLWHSWTTDKRAALEAAVEAFNCRHDQARVVAEPLGPSAGNVAEKLLLNAPGVSPPALAMVTREAIPRLAEAGLIRDVESLLKSTRSPRRCLSRNNLLKSSLDFGTYKGRTYGIPVYLNPLVLIYNPQILSALGISEPPSQWEDFVEIARELENAGHGAGAGAGQRRWALSTRSMAPLFHVLCVQQGIDLYDLKSDAPSADALGEILSRIQGFRKAPSLLPPQRKFWDPNFIGVAGGNALFQLDTAEVVANLVKEDSGPVEVVMVPSGNPASLTYLAGSPLFVVPASGREDDAVMDFLETFFSRESYSVFANRFLFVSPLTRESAADQNAVMEDRIYARLALAGENAATHTLRSDAGKTMPQIARTVEQLDAGLISRKQAIKEILDDVRKDDAEMSQSPQPGLRVLWAESTRRLSRTETVGLKPLPVRITSAANEHESFQLGILPTHSAGDFDVNVEPFVSTEGLPAKIKTTVYRETDTLISKPLVATRGGGYPNVLEPVTRLRAPCDTMTRLWIDVFVSGEVPAGEYTSSIVIADDTSRLARVPMRVQVWPLRLPEAPSHPATIGLNYDLIADHYGLEPKGKRYASVMDSFYWFLVERGLSPYVPPVPIDSARAGRYLTDKRVSACRLPFHPADPRFRKAVSAGNGNGWLNKLFSYFIDEPTYHQYRAIIETGTQIDVMSPSPKFLVTCFPDDALAGAVDIWCIHMRFLPEGIPHGSLDRGRYAEIVKRYADAGNEIWWYTAGAVRPIPTLHIEDDPNAFRIIPWLQELCDIDGFLHWEAANWKPPFPKPFVPHFGNGEGVLVYPGELRPLPSIRLELLREGLEDREYLILLRRKIEEAQRHLGAERLGEIGSVRAGEFCRRLIVDEALQAHASNAALMVPHFTRQPARIERVREEIAEEIIQLDLEPRAIVLTEPEERRYTDMETCRVYGVAEAGCIVDINRRDVTVGPTGDFSITLPLTSGENTLSIRVQKGDHRKTFVRKIERP